MWAVFSPIPTKREGDGSFFCSLTRRKFLCYGKILRFFKTSQSFDQITTLTYFLMDNFLSLFKLAHIISWNILNYFDFQLLIWRPLFWIGKRMVMCSREEKRIINEFLNHWIRLSGSIYFFSYKIGKKGAMLISARDSLL